jgi:hypothetical protein
MKSIRIYLLGMLAMLSAASCRKEITPEPQNPIESLARATLQSRMSSGDFGDLDWSKKEFLTGKSGESDAMIRIPSKTVQHKMMYFKNQDGVSLFNWVEIQNETKKMDRVSADVILSDARNKVLKRFSVADNKYVAGEYAAKATNGKNVKLNEDEPVLSGSGGDAVVTGYIKSRNLTQTYWRLDFLLVGSANESLYTPEESGSSGGGWSATFIFEDPKPDDVDPDTTYITPEGLKHFTANSYLMVLGRVITVDFNVNMSTYEASNVNVRIAGVGVYGITYVGVKSSYAMGFPDKDLYIELNMTYTVVNFTPFGIPFDVTFPVHWTIRVPGINQGGNKVKLY